MRAFVSRIGLAAWCSLALAVVVAAATVVTLLPLSSDMPHWDQWIMAPVFAEHHAGRPVLPLLLVHYNGHYNWLSRFLFYEMGLLSRWSMRVEVLVGFAWAACTLGVLLRMLWETSPRLLILAAPFAAWVFSVLQFANFLNGWGMGQLLAGFAALSSLYLLTDPRASRLRFSLALLAAAAAFTSHGAGIALAPAGLVALLFIGPRRNWSRIAAWSLIGALGVGLGVMGGRNTHLVVHWRRLPALVLTLLGRPLMFDLSPSPRRAAAVGALVVLMLMVVLGWRIWSEWPAKRDVLVRWGCVALLPVAASVLISVARSAAPLQVVTSSHYVTSTYPLALALLALVADRLHDAMTRRTGGAKWLTGLALAACCVAPAAQQALAAYGIVPVLRNWKGVTERVSRRLAVGTATDQEILQSVHTGVDEVRSGLELLRTRRLAWFAHAPEARRPFGALERVSGQPPAPVVTLRKGVPWVFEGWVLPPMTALQTPVQAALLVDGTQVVASTPDRVRPDMEAYYGSRSFLMSGFALIAPDGERRPPGRYQVRVVARSPPRTVTVQALELVVLPR